MGGGSAPRGVPHRGPARNLYARHANGPRGGTIVALKSIRADEGSGAHAGVLEVGRRRTDLPGRILTTSELRSAKTSKLAESVESSLLIVGKLGSPELVKAATSEEEAWQRFARGVSSDARLLPGAARMLQIAFRETEFEDAEPLRALLDLQHLVGLDVLTVTYGSAPSSEDVVTAFDFARSWAKKRRLDAPLMPIVPASARRENADAVLASLVTRGAQALGIDLQGGFPYHTLRAVEALKEKHPEIWVHAFQVPPKVRFGGPLAASQAMVLPFFGVDTFSRWVRPPPPAPVKKEKVNVFDPRGWGVLKWREQEREYGAKLACRCAVCKKSKDLDGFFEPEDRAVLNLAKVHDHLSQGAELTAARARIGKEGYASAMEDHRFARAFLKRVAERESGEDE